MPCRVVVYLALSIFLQQIVAHGGVRLYWIEGRMYDGWYPYNTSDQPTIQRRWSAFDPIKDLNDPNFACNDDGSSGPLQRTATVRAGSTVTAKFGSVGQAPWPHRFGIMLTYLASCLKPTCDGVNATQLPWFKIDEGGLLNGTLGTGEWAAGLMIQQNSTWTSRIPLSVPSGSYLLRFETIALHVLPPEVFAECAQINIIQGGSLAPTPDELVLFPGGYSSSDPGLSVNIYGDARTETNYTMPGPKLYRGAVHTIPPSS